MGYNEVAVFCRRCTLHRGYAASHILYPPLGDNVLGTLNSRFPSARRLQLQPRPQGDQQDGSLTDLTRQIEPYLHWTLLEVDSNSTDILIGEPDSVVQPGQPRNLIILGGEAAQVWLRNVRKSEH